MNIKANLALNDHDIRLNLFLGIANWSLFLDHIPNNVVNWITTRNYGFSGAADLFIFISGYTAATVYAKIMLERGFVVGATRIFKRVWQLYAAYIVLFTIYIVAIGYVAAQYSAPDLINEFNVSALIDHPIRILGHALFLQSKALNLDVLQLYTLLMLLFAPVLWVMLRRPALTMAAIACALFRRAPVRLEPVVLSGRRLVFQSVLLATAVRVRRLARAQPRAGHSVRCCARRSRFILAIAYLIFALVMTMAGRFPAFGTMFPSWLFDAFNPNDKDNLAPYRVLHFVVVVFVVTRFIPKDWPGLRWPIFDPLVKCGEQSLRGVLRRGVSVLHRPFHADDQFGLGDDADPGQR